MKLLSMELKKKLPPLGTTEYDADPMIRCKFFTPDAHWTWYAIEFDGQDIFWGWVEGDFPEFGYFSLAELESVRGPLGLPIERDLYFGPCRLSEVRGA